MVDLVSTTKETGLVGAGGAGFPTHIKLSSPAGTLIINSAECEPGLAKDLAILSERADQVLSSALMVAKNIGAKRIVLAIKEKHSKLLKILQETISVKKEFQAIELFLLPDIYPIGDEFLLVEAVTGRRVPQGGLPPQVGSLVHNVETLYNINRAVNKQTPITKILTVLGEIRSPGVYEVPLGISFGDIIAQLGGVSCENPRLVADGLMMGKPVSEQGVVEKTTSSLFVLPRHNRSVMRMSFNQEQVKRQGRSACEQCRLCTDLCPRYLLGYDIEPHRVMQAWCYSLLETPPLTMVFNCCECGICEQFACPMDLSPRKVCAILKEELRSLGVGAESSSPPQAINTFRQDRMVPTERLLSRLGLNDYKIDDLNIKKLIAERVSIPLQGAFGEQAKPTVRVGDSVKGGQILATPADDGLGVAVHSSIAGKVWKIDHRVHISAG